MLRWVIMIFVIALIAAVFGFGGIAADAAEIALGVFVITLLAGMAVGRTLPDS
jgi:uncharacterized membrane protein YtjA (UPF0391 family)